MPELVYKVKFEIDSSIDTISSIVDPNSFKEVQDLKKSFSDLENKYKELQESFKGGGGSGGAVGGASDGFLDLMQNVKTTTSEIRKNTSSFKKSIVTADQTTEAFIDQSEALSTGSTQLQRLREELEQAAQQENLTDKQTEQLNNTINSLSNVQRTAVSASKNFKDGLRVIEHQSGTMNKAFSGSNQLLFSFSDLVQDSTQFSQGFAQGMRAIGNNVGFTAELFANLTVNVDRHNKLVADGTLKNEKQITTFGALKNSLKGAGGALIAINGAVMATTLIFQALDNRLKETRESAKAQAEAFSDVAKTFSDVNTGIADPFGLRARAVEIKVLSEQVGMTVDELSEQVAQAFEETGKMNKFQSFMAEKLLPTILNVTAAFDKQTAEQLIQLEANAELRKEIEKQKQVQEAFQKLLETDEPLRNYVNLTKDLSLVMAESKTGVDLTALSLEDLAKQNQDQIDFLTGKNDLTEQEIGLLFRLLEVQDSVNAAKQKEIDLMLQREKVAMDTAGIDAQTQGMRTEIDILKTRDERRKISLASEKREKDIKLKLDSELFSARSAFLKEELTEEEHTARVKAISDKAEAASDLNAEQTKLEQLDLTKQNVQFALDAAKNFTSSFGALKGQEIDAEIKAAKARGASAKEIEKLQRKKFKQEKAAQLASAVINTAAAVSESLPNVGKSIAVGALGAIQIATILKTKFGGGAPSAGGGGGGAAAQGLFATSGGERQTRLDRSLFRGERSGFVPRAQGGAQRFAITVNNTFDEQTAASVVHAGNDQRREGAVSAT